MQSVKIHHVTCNIQLNYFILEQSNYSILKNVCMQWEYSNFSTMNKALWLDAANHMMMLNLSE